MIPRLDPSSDLQLLEGVAERVLAAHGFEPSLYQDEAEARDAVDRDIRRGRYPLLLTPLDTSGEKAYEEFVADDETAIEIGLPGLLAVSYVPAPEGAVRELVDRFAALIADPGRPIDKHELAREVARIVPQFAHVETGRTLDARM